MKTITEQLVQHVIRPRAPMGHKGTFGRVLVVGGNPRMGGAAILAASAAVYAGAGLVTVATAAVNRDALHARLPEAMVLPYDVPDLAGLIPTQTAVVVGPGLGTDHRGLAVLQTVLAAIQPSQTLIIDGSAITLMATHQLALPDANLIWTPHQAEWARLSGVPVEDQTPETNTAAAAKIRGTVIVKSHRTQIFTPTASYENPVGSSAMATGGSGDTLTGILAAFVAQFGVKEATVLAAVYTHSAVADHLAATHYVAVPSLVIQALPHYMARMAAAPIENGTEAE